MGDQDLNPICHACYKSLEFSPVKLAETNTGCLQVDQHNPKIPKVKMIALPSGSVYLEERLGNTSRVERGRCCKFHFRRKPDCWKGSSCHYAHDEVDVFNSHGYIKEVCNECLKTALGKLELLQRSVCLKEEHKGRDFPDNFLWCLPLKEGVISICRPISINADEMRRDRFDFVMQHTFLNCFYGVMACHRPHTKVEEDVWNKWNKSGETRMKLHNKGKIFYIELIEERKLAIASVEEGKREENAKQHRLLQEQRALHQVVHDYKENFNTLLETEMSAITKSIESSLKETFQMKAVPEELVMGSHDHYRLVIMNQEVSEFLEKHVESVHVLVYPRRGTPAHSMQRFNALVHKVHSKGLILQPEPYFRSQMPLPVDCAVSLQLKSEKSQFQFLQRVLNQLKAEIISRVNPNVEKFKLVKRNKSFEAYSKNTFLSVDALFQQNAIQLALNAPHDGPPFLLIGPFGTGKTRLIARMTCEVLMDPTSRVLICTHHNQTADSYIKAYFSKVRNLPCAPVRLVSKTKVDKRQKEGASYFLSNYEMSKEELFENYKKSRLIVTTTMTAYSMHDMNLHFSHIFLDEAAQCNEIEAMIPLSLAGPETKIVLAGDHLQVGPGDSLRSSNSDVVRGDRAPNLATSLLTRLHQLYTKFLKQSEIKNDPRILSYMASLLTNYRCHAGILRLPSNLFYESSLLARAHYELHSQVNSSLCFHCTSLKTQAWSREMQEEEIRIMMNKAYNLFKTWPEEWKKLGESNNSICIMMRTHEQLRSIKNQLSQFPDFKKAVILRTIYSIQGLEFTAVFLCTTEPYDVVGGNPVPRKQAIGSSIMNKRVFNTVLTRAKALFIAFGNPFYLMNAEGDSDCWREYIKRCTESDSFVFEQQPSDEQKELLLNQVFQNPVNKVSLSDTFLEQYAKEFIEQLEFDGSHWQITKPDTEEEGDTFPARDEISGKECILEYHSMKYAEAVPTSKELRKEVMFAIQGMKSREQALHGATVLVQPFASKTGRLSGLIGGMVVHVIKQSEEQLFLCKIDPFNSSRFIPLNEKGPKLANLPPISSKLLQLEMAESEIKERSKHNKINPVPCFDLHQLAKGIPKLKDVIPFETAKKLLFLVKFMSWPKGRFFPMAGVVEAFPGVHSTFCAARLSTAIAKLSHSSQHPNDHTSSFNDQFNINSVKKALECSSNCKLANVEILEFKGKDINFSSKDICDESLPIGLKYLTLGSVFETFPNSSNQCMVRSKWKFKIISTKSPKEFLDVFTNFKELRDPAVGDTLLRHRELNTGDEIQISLVITRSDGSQIRRFNASTPKKMSSNTSSTASVNSAHEYRTIGKSSIAPLLKEPIGVYQFEISCNLAQKEILPVWIGADTSTPIIKPEIQLISPGPYLEICVPHSVRPGECFSNPILRHASLDKYSDIQQYQDLWKAVIVAESAYSSTADQNSEVLFLDNILLDWGESQLIRVNSLMNDPTYQSHGIVSFSLSRELLKASGQFISLQPGDFICARYGPQLSAYSLLIESMQQCQKSVFHFVVKAIVDHKEDSSQLVKLEMIGEQNAHISENMFNVLRKEKFQLSCRLQIINCPIPQRRIYESISTDGSSLSNVISLGYVGLINSEKMKSNLLSQSCHFDTSYLNSKQIEGAKRAIDYRFTLIQGPPGTGKSRTGAYLATLFAKLNIRLSKKESVLYCAPSNPAVDVVLGYLKELKCPYNILRIYSRAIESQSKEAGPRYKQDIFKQIEADKCPLDLEMYSLHAKVLKTKYGTEIKKMEKDFKMQRKKGEIPTYEEEGEYKKLINKAEKLVLTQTHYHIVLCTCNEAASSRMKKYFTVGQCIIDECGFATEPEVMIPIKLSSHVVLIGDHKQLQPIIRNKMASENGLNISLFERYAEKYRKAREGTQEAPGQKHLFIQLEEQYRMHPAICELTAMSFYNGNLTLAASIRREIADSADFWPKRRDRSSSFPIKIINVVGTESSPKNPSSDKTGPESKENEAETIKVVELVSRLKRLYPDKGVAILTPYLGQKDCLMRTFRLKPHVQCPEIKTINESQGSEHDIVILSTVRSMPHYSFDPSLVRGDKSWSNEHLGFITDPHQICVGISRSRYGLIIVGNTKLLKCDPTWYKIIQFYNEKTLSSL